VESTSSSERLYRQLYANECIHIQYMQIVPTITQISALVRKVFKRKLLTNQTYDDIKTIKVFHIEIGLVFGRL